MKKILVAYFFLTLTCLAFASMPEQQTMMPQQGGTWCKENFVQGSICWVVKRSRPEGALGFMVLGMLVFYKKQVKFWVKSAYEFIKKD